MCGVCVDMHMSMAEASDGMCVCVDCVWDIALTELWCVEPVDTLTCYYAHDRPDPRNVPRELFYKAEKLADWVVRIALCFCWHNGSRVLTSLLGIGYCRMNNCSSQNMAS
jgi:hypothetical protein